MAAERPELKEARRLFNKAVERLAALDQARRDFRAAALAAHDAGVSKAELARTFSVSRQRVDEILKRARHEAAVGIEDVTD